MQQTVLQYKRVIIVVIVLIVVAVAAFSLGHHHTASSTNQPQVKTVTITPSGIKYPSGWQETDTITLAEQQAGVFSVAEHYNPNAEVIARSQPYTLPKDFNINTVPAETVSKLQSSLNGFKLVSDNVTKAGNLPAVSVTYTIAGDPVYQYTELIVPTTNTTYYQTISSKQSDFASLSSDASNITTAFANYIASK